MKKRFGRDYLRCLLSFSLMIWFSNIVADSSLFSKHKSAHIPGNITLGGLFPIHSDAECTEINGVLGIQRLEAMLFAVDRINKDNKILPGITLGVSAFDTCANETQALDRTVEEFITDQKCDSKEEEGLIGGRQVVGVIGPLYSSISVQVAHLLRLFKMPQISYDSTSSELSDKTKYEYFLRTAPSDYRQARAIIDILKHFNWSYVSAVYSDDSYGRKGIEALSSEAIKKGICIAVRKEIPFSSKDKTKISGVIKDLEKEKKARVVIVFCSKKETIRSLLNEAKEQNVIDHFQWIGSDSWITVNWLEELQPSARGLISVQPMSKPIQEFRDYLVRRMPSSTDVNPWFRDYFQETVKCHPLSYKGEKKYSYCESFHSLNNTNLTIDDGVSRTIDAVYAFAHALQKIQVTKCPERPGVICREMEKTYGKELLSTIKYVTFSSMTRETISFNQSGDVPARYDIYYFNESGTGIYENVRIGEWTDKLTMYSTIRDTFIPKESFCGRPCKDNQVKGSIPGKQSCCWECVECTGNKFAYNETYCKECPLGYWPDSSKRGCVRLPARYFTINQDYVGWHLVLPPLIVSVLGIISVLFIVTIFIRFNDTPLVKASGRELSYLLLTGLFLCYGVLCVCLIRPSPYVCLLEFILDSLPFTICYAAVIVKTNRISRIFNSRNLTKRPQFIHPQSQICFAFSLVAIQVLLLTAFCILQLPQANLLYLSDSDVVLICAISDKDFLLSQIYNFVLILICTYYAFKTRRSPMNFNEAKYIAFAMYCTCVLWLAFITVYLVQTDVMLKSCIRCLSVSLIATILLVCLFVPKVYIIIFKPSENRKRPTLPSHSVSSLVGEQAVPTRCHSGPHHDASNARDWRLNGNGESMPMSLRRDKGDGTFQRGPFRPRSSTEPRRLDNDRKTWRYSLPPEQFSQPSERVLEKEEEMEMEMKALIERLSMLEALLNQQRQTCGSYRTREIQGALKSCQGLIAEVNKQSECSIPECVEEDCREDDHCGCPVITNMRKKPDNRSLLMTYAQTANNANPRNFPKSTLGNHTCTYRNTNGRDVSTGSLGSCSNSISKGNNEKLNLLQNPVSTLNRRSASEA